MLIVDVADHVAVVTLNRPSARNALNPELIVELDRCWQELRDHSGVRTVVLTGAAGSTFCAGFDLAQTIPLLTGARAPADEWDRAVTTDPAMAGRACLREADLGKPLIVAANGHAIAGGMELLRAGDLRVVARGAKLGLSEVKLGLIPAMGGTATLARHLPRAIAAEMLLTGEPILDNLARQEAGRALRRWFECHLDDINLFYKVQMGSLYYYLHTLVSTISKMNTIRLIGTGGAGRVPPVTPTVIARPSLRVDVKLDRLAAETSFTELQKGGYKKGSLTSKLASSRDPKESFGSLYISTKPSASAVSLFDRLVILPAASTRLSTPT